MGLPGRKKAMDRRSILFLAISSVLWFSFPAIAQTEGETPAPTVKKVGPGWYFGDTHMHTTHSDGSASVADMVASATSKGLDFIIITDHNTIAQKEDVEKIDVPGFLCLFGEEVSSQVGHCNAYFIDRVIDWKTDSNQQLIDWVHEDGGLIFANHPHYPKLEWQDWNVEDLDGVEVWNGFYSPRHEVNAKSFDDWDRELNEGHRLVGLANSDAHNPGKVGNPRMGFYLDALSPDQVREAMENGRIYGTNGPRVRFTVGFHGLGSIVRAKREEPVNILVETESENPVRKIILIRNGETVATREDQSDMIEPVTASEDCWYRVEVEDSDSGFAFTNPIWIDVE